MGRLQVPNDAALIGVTGYAQGVVPSPAANPAGLVVSRSLALRAGAQ